MEKEEIVSVPLRGFCFSTVPPKSLVIPDLSKPFAERRLKFLFSERCQRLENGIRPYMTRRGADDGFSSRWRLLCFLFAASARIPSFLENFS